MSYSEDYRKGILKLLGTGETLESVHQKLGVSISAMSEWRRKAKKGESLKTKELNRKARKFEDEELKELVAKDCDITYEKIARHFNGSVGGAFEACTRNKITIKKDKSIRRTR